MSRPRPLALPAALAVLVALAAGLPGPSSAADDASQTVTISGTHRIQLPAHPQRLKAGEFSAVTGQYALADGRTLTVAGTPGHMTAEMEGVPRVELVAASPTSYVARNQRLALSFDQEANGSVTGVVVTWLAPVETKGRRQAPAR